MFVLNMWGGKVLVVNTCKVKPILNFLPFSSVPVNWK